MFLDCGKKLQNLDGTHADMGENMQTVTSSPVIPGLLLRRRLACTYSSAELDFK